MINIQPVFLSEVIKYDRKRYNTNNHWDKELGRPKNYDEILSLGNTSKWIDLFHKDYKTFTIKKKDIKWIYEASLIGNTTLKLSHMFDEDLEDFIKENETVEKNLFTDPQGYFIRSESISLKYGKHGAGPYHNFKDIIESIATTTSTHRCIAENDTECKLFLMKYLPEFKDPRTLEFRIFVYMGKITAISQQHLYKVDDVLVNMDHKTMIKKIIQYFESEIKDKISYVDSYVMDFALLGSEQKPYFIEINSFGKEYASGSALFGWIQDYNILYGDGNEIVFRYTI